MELKTEGFSEARIERPKPELKELDRLRLERLNLSISNLNLQLALLNERARALQIETAGFWAEREGLVKQIMENMESTDCVSGKWRLNPDTLKFEKRESAGQESAVS
ncbi:MAG: hypothetical protein Q6354_06335 [Candidatus Brocadiales bacterium]|nr:hypothetical protein [Candidatus Brocadiales bacterium]